MVIVPNSALDNRIVFLWQALYNTPLPTYLPEQVSGNGMVCYDSSAVVGDATAHGNVHVAPCTLGWWSKLHARGYAGMNFTDWALGNNDFFIDLVAQCASAINDFTIFEVFKDANNFFGLYRIYSTRTLRFYAKSGGVCIADYHTDDYYPWFYWWHISVWRTGGNIGIAINGYPEVVHEVTDISTTALPSGMIYLLLGRSQGGFAWQNTAYLWVRYMRVCKGAVPLDTGGFVIAATTYPNDVRAKRIMGVYI